MTAGHGGSHELKRHPDTKLRRQKSDPASGVAKLDHIDAHLNVGTMRLVPDAATR
jgi:hypothetical protein